MLELLKEFENRKPEIIFEWHDPHSEARGWVVINSLRGGAAGGGTRMRKGLDKAEVIALAKTMEVKFTISGPAIGGAKSGIDFDPRDPRKNEVLKRWYRAVTPLLKNYYGTGGDLNVDEIDEVIPMTEAFGVWHPQEGIVNGHYLATEPQKIKKLGQLRQGVSKVIEDFHFTPKIEEKLTIADMITGFGVAEAVKSYYKIWKGNMKGKSAIIQGWGNVGSAAGYYLSGQGIKIIGIIDKHGGLINENGFDFEQIKAFYLNKKGNKLNEQSLMSFREINSKIWDLKADIFIPAAASRLVSKDQIKKLISNGLEVISCGANVPFKDPEIFFGETADFADNNVALIPDFIANCGMARVFAYLMEAQIEVTDEAIFKDTSDRIYNALKRVFQSNPNNNGIAKASLSIALNKLL